MSYDRCQKHNLMRCAQCAPVKAHHAAPSAHVAPANFSPEDALDQSIGAPSAPTVPGTAAPAVDKQALEAIERRKAMQTRAPVDVNFGDVSSGVTIVEIKPETIYDDEPSFGRSNTITTTKVEPVAETIITHDEFGGHVVEHFPADPLMAAAQGYHKAKTQVEIAAKKIGLLRIDLQEAKNTLRSARKEVRARKAELKKLVQA